MVINIKKLTAVAVSVVLVAIALWNFRMPVDKVTPKQEHQVREVDSGLKKTSFFPLYRMERERVRSQQLELLRAVMESQNSNEATRQKAADQLLMLTNNMELELKAEGLLKARGCKEAVAIIQGNGATLVAYGVELDEEKKNQLLKEVSRMLGLEQDKIDVVWKSSEL